MLMGTRGAHIRQALASTLIERRYMLSHSPPNEEVRQEHNPRWRFTNASLECVSMHNHGIEIAGGGLVGLSLGIALRLRGVAVVVREAGSYPRHRVCGEFVSGVDDAVLERLGVAGCFAGHLPRRTLCWHSHGKLVVEDALPVPARAISRHLLDARLAEKFTSLGGLLETGARVATTPGEGRVWAAGRPKLASATRIGLKAHVRGIDLRADLEMHSGRNGYAGLTAVEGGWTNVCGIFRVDRKIAARGPDLLPAYLEAGGNPALARALRAAEWRDGSFSAVAGFEPGIQPGRAGELCLGDAAQMIPPFTGNGMSMAFETADAAIDPLTDWASGHLSWQAACNAVQRAISRRFRKRMVTAAWIEPIITREAACAVLGGLAALRLLPFRRMVALVR
jgi:flavin-dependent dehydrogenase